MKGLVPFESYLQMYTRQAEKGTKETITCIKGSLTGPPFIFDRIQERWSG